MDISSIHWITMLQGCRWANIYFIWGSVWCLLQCSSRLIGVGEDQVFNSLISVHKAVLKRFWYWIFCIFVVVGVTWTDSLVDNTTWTWQCCNFQFWQGVGNFRFYSLIWVQMSWDSHCMYRGLPSTKHDWWLAWMSLLLTVAELQHLVRISQCQQFHSLTGSKILGVLAHLSGYKWLDAMHWCSQEVLLWNSGTG